MIEGDSWLFIYMFGMYIVMYYFCYCCGVVLFSYLWFVFMEWVINLCCVDGVDLVMLEVYCFDG